MTGAMEWRRLALDVPKLVPRFDSLIPFAALRAAADIASGEATKHRFVNVVQPTKPTTIRTK